ncbi:MAG: DUF3168 domain-containing protein [Ardenticatenales bacterium]
MATVEESIRYALGTDAAVAALVDDRIYPNKIPPDDAPTPWVYYTLPDSDPLESLDLDGTGEARHTLEVDVLADDYATLASVVDAVRSALNGYRGGQIKRAFWTGSRSEFVDAGYHAEVSFQVRAFDALIVPTEAGLPRVETRSTGLYFGGDLVGSRPSHSTDAAAVNDSLFYSTSQSKLAYKDSSGTVHPLY